MSMISIEEAVKRLDADTTWKRYQVAYPEDSLGPFSLKRFQIDKWDFNRMRIIRDEGMDRDTGYGDFVKLTEYRPGEPDPKDRTLIWMSDTRAEIMEHTPIFNKLFWTHFQQGKRILVNGLGLGLVVHGCLIENNGQYPRSVAHVDVVEKNHDIIELIGKYLPEDKVTIHEANAYEKTWPRGTRWDLIWHDIWPYISDENLPGMRDLRRKYKGRAGWQGFWQIRGCKIMARQIQQAKDGTLPVKTAEDLLARGFHF